ncbi:uncharacterized protein LOC127730201 [Mytilus californianus]|uniref:uncharacterized protein LOC127730201 n=1 Tax=Mytilus californianus TaxID=6549 RepID=UPI002247E778|nr:uncharacterized protein LOC127730201 [Mytilus californianus]
MSSIKKCPVPDIKDKREILGEHLYVKISHIINTVTGHVQVSENSELISKVTGILLEREDDELLRMLRDDSFLRKRVEEVVSHPDIQPIPVDPYELKDDSDHTSSTNEEFLFDSVQSLDSEHCSKITGMILELGKENVEVLLQDNEKLQLAVEKARLAINSSERDFIGEMLYQKIETVYPEHVEKITGMLVEMETEKLKDLLQDEHLLRQCIDKAYAALNKVS